MAKINKIFCAGLCTILTISVLLTGCSGTGVKGGSPIASTNTAASSTSASLEPTKEVLEPVTLKWYVESTPQKDLQNVLDEANKTIKDKINATLDLQMIDWGSWEDKIKLIILSGEDYDLCFTSSWSNFFGPNLAKNAFLPLDDLLNNYGQDILKTVPEKYWSATKKDNKIYGIINYQEMYDLTGLYARKDLLDKYKFDIKSVKNLVDIEPFLEAVKNGEKGITPVAMPSYGLPTSDTEFGPMYDWVAGPFAIEYGDKDLKVIDNSDSHLILPICKLFRSWFLKGYIAPDAALQKDYAALAKSGKFAVFRANGVSPSFDNDQSSANGYEVVSVPLTSPTVATGNVLSTLTAINRSSKNPERAMMLVNLMFSDLDLFNLLSNGIEGTHYTKAENAIEKIKDSGYDPGISWELGSKFNEWLIKGSDPSVKDFKKKMNDEAIPAPTLGFTFDPEPVKNEMAQCDNVSSEIMPLLCTGSGDPEKLSKKLEEKLIAAGKDKVKLELEKQLNAWKQANGK